ncbi:hypothetical protein [Sphingomonas sp.]|uniref:hypothetical protein n=1 Tax=Sphingomonas sp. TaxID=28214 RepID=UPI0035C83C7A
MILDLRDRMVRIETKLDTHHEAHVVIDKRLDDLDTRTEANTTAIAASRVRVATLSAVASAVVAGLSLLGDHLWTFLSGTL